MADENKNEPIKALEDLSLKQLQEKLTEHGFLQAEILNTKAQCIALLLNFQQKEAEAQKQLEDATNAAKDDALASVVPTGSPAVVPQESPAEVAQSEKQWRGKAAAMKANLDKQPKVRFVVPLEFGEKPGAYETVIMNGYRMNIMKGVPVDLPEQVANHLVEAYRMTAVAGQDFAVDRNDTVRDRLQ